MSKHKNPALTVDILIKSEDKLILIKRGNGPYKDCWALPGGFVEYGEQVEYAALRETKEETGLDVKLNKLVGVYSDPNRDPRGHVVTVAFTAQIIRGELKSDSDAKDAKYININELKTVNLAFDHEEILKDAGLL